MDDLLGIGRTAEVFAHGDNRVLKLFYPGFSEEAIATEMQIGLILNQAPGLAPYCDGRVVQSGRQGIVYEKVAGQPLTGRLVSQPFGLRAHAETLAIAHLSIFKTPRLELPAIQERLSWALAKVNYLEPDELAALQLLLAKLPVGDKVLHGDFHPMNLMVAQGSFQVIDWTTAAIGQALADIARTLVILRFGRAPAESQSPVMHRISLAYTRLLARHYERRMRKVLAYNPADLTAWLVVVAAARLSELPAEVEMQEIRTWLRRQLRKLS